MNELPSRKKEFGLAITAIGIVFGDIGTSPLYALRESFLAHEGMQYQSDNIIGIVSLLIWTLSLVVCVKYLGFVLKADNKGEGGVLALVSLISRYIPKSHVRRTAFVAALGVVGAALLYSDGMLTPCGHGSFVYRRARDPDPETETVRPSDISRGFDSPFSVSVPEAPARWAVSSARFCRSGL